MTHLAHAHPRRAVFQGFALFAAAFGALIGATIGVCTLVAILLSRFIHA
jgi:hypothetical protein